MLMRIVVKKIPQHTVKDVKKQIEEKQKSPSQKKSSAAEEESLWTRKIEEYNMNEKETIEMTALLIDGTKNRDLSPASKKEERDKKGKLLNHALTSFA